MPGSSPKHQFEAAVQLIRGLPKDGPFQPSNDMKLRLYGFFKQATDGPCVQPAPSFWDVIGKAKWGAWKNVGDMPAEEAMSSYVDEIKKVMETMSLTDDVANLMDTLGPVYEYVEEGGGRPARKKHVRFSADEEAAATNGHGPAAAAEAAEGAAETASRPAPETNGVQPPPAADGTNGSGEQPQQPERWAGSATSDTDDDEEFNDPIGETEAVAGRGAGTEARLDALHHQLLTLSRLVDSAGLQMNGAASDSPVVNGSHSAAAGLVAAARGTAAPLLRAGSSSCPGVHDELRALVRDMRDDLDTVTGRLRSLEADHSGGARSDKRAVRPWWQVPELTSRSLVLLLAWPLVLQLVLRLLRNRRRR